MNRMPVLDYIRAACILYVVGFWHLFNYTDALDGYENGLTYRITVCVLGLFVLLSGFLMGKKSIPLNKDGILGFYESRLMKLYPAFIIALVLFDIFKIADPLTILKSIFLGSMFFGPPPPTLWFVVMLLNFYVLAPFLIALRDKPPLFFALLFGTMGLMTGFHFIHPAMDIRLVMYLPAFGAGIYMAGREITPTNKTLLFTALAGIAAFAVTIIFDLHGYSERSFWSIPLAVLMPLAVFLACLRFQYLFKPAKVVFWISSVSFFVYLFHRPVYKLMSEYLMPAADIAQISFLLAICLPLAIGISWGISKIYDRLLFGSGHRT